MKDITQAIKGSLADLNHYSIPPGHFAITEPIEIKYNQSLVGASMGASRLEYRGMGDYGVIIGKDRVPAYRATAADFTINGAGVDIQRASDQTRIRDISVSRCGASGFNMYKAEGSRLVFDGLVARECGGPGFRVMTDWVHNGLVFQNCSAAANGGPGLFVGTDWNYAAYLPNVRVQGGTFQGNNRDAGEDEPWGEVVLYGNVIGATFVGTHIETVGSRRCGMSLHPGTLHKGSNSYRAPEDLRLDGVEFQGSDMVHSVTQIYPFGEHQGAERPKLQGGHKIVLTNTRLRTPMKLYAKTAVSSSGYYEVLDTRWD